MNDQEIQTLATDDLAGTDYHFGVCPECGSHDGYINVGRGHWFHCREHHTRWFVGANLFDSWKSETKDEQRRAYEELDFASYREVEARRRTVDPPTPADLDYRLAELEERVDLLTYRLARRGGAVV